MGFGSVVNKIPRKGIVSQLPTPDDQGISDSKWIWKTMGDIPITKSYAYYLISGPPIGTVKKYNAGWCLKKGLGNPKKRTFVIDTKPQGTLNIPGINPKAFGNIKNIRGLIPGVFNDMYDINPENLWNNMQGKGIIKDCFTNYSKIKNKKYDFKSIFIIFIICIIYIILNCFFYLHT